jgi:DNA-binding transcriptional LysR family regulator
MELTEAGQSLFQDAKDLFARLDQALASSRSIARGEQGALRIGIAPTAPFHPFVPRSIRAFRSAHPQIALTISEGLSNEVQRELALKQSDVAFVRIARLADEQLHVDLLFEEPLIAALPTSHRLVRDRRDPLPALSSLQDDPFVLYGPPGTGLYDETLRVCAVAGFVPTIGQQASRIASTLGLVAAGMGVALVPASMRHVAVDGVAYRRLPASVAAKAVLGLASRRHDPSVVVQSFVKLTKEAAQGFREKTRSHNEVTRL